MGALSRRGRIITMADRYQSRPFPADDHDRGGDQHDPGSDPLAELARLIGQTDPFSTTGKSNPAPSPVPRAAPRYEQPRYEETQNEEQQYDEAGGGEVPP